MITNRDPTIMARAILCLLFTGLLNAAPAPYEYPSPVERFQKKLEPVITPPVLPILEHLERDPSTLLSNENVIGNIFGAAAPGSADKPKFGNSFSVTPSGFGDKPKFGNNFSVTPSGNGGLTASLSSSVTGAGFSQASSQSYSFGFNEAFSASHSASQSSSFSSGYNSGLSASQASSQSAVFGGNSAAAAASSAAALAAGGLSGSQSAASSFGFNGNNGHNDHNGYNGYNGYKHSPSQVSSQGYNYERHQGSNPGAIVFPGPTYRGSSYRRPNHRN